jgi:hypothetical protein
LQIFVDTKLNAPLAEYVQTIEGLNLFSTEELRKHFSSQLLTAVPMLSPLLDNILVVSPPLLMKINIPTTLFRGFLLFKPQQPATLFSQIELSLKDASKKTPRTKELKKLVTPALEFCKIVKLGRLDTKFQPSQKLYTAIDKAFKLNELLESPLSDLHVLPRGHFIQLTDGPTGGLIFETVHGLFS